MTEKLFTAKSGKSPYEWLPLYMHMEDTVRIMDKLLEDFVSKSFPESCGLPEKDFSKTAKFLAYVHDIGKSTVGFQYKISKNVSERTGTLEHYGIEIPAYMDKSSVRNTPHALAGEIILRYFNCPAGVAAVVGAHHGVPAESVDLRKQDISKRKENIVGYENYFGDNNRSVLEKIWKKFIDNAFCRAEINSMDELPELSSKAQLLLSGLLAAADWIASNTEYFPLISVDDTGDENYYPQRVEQAWEKIGFPEIWIPEKKSYSDADFNDVFGFFPKEAQKAMLDIVAGTEKTGLFILEAPMGYGKTEAALAAAELLASKALKKGIFFGLPTQATANGIFPRIMNWAEKQSEEFYHSIQLKHGNSALNKTFTKIQKGIPEEESDSGLIIHSWFCDNKKACLADFVVATVDQMLMSALKRRYVMLLHLGLSEKVVIIDEVHAYDAYMNQYLERALQWLGAYQTPVILLSATLPVQRRISLLSAYLQKNIPDFEENKSYPLLTWTDGEEIHQKALPYVGTHKSVTIKKCCDDNIFSLVNEAVKSGGCVGIILNTVSRVQKIYDVVSGEITDNVILCHAQFTMPDRILKESEILQKTGKNSSEKIRKGLVVTGTQVLEQSLDIDFDLLITDICPMDLLLQRIGRLQRHERSYRPHTLKEPVCYVVTDEYDNEKTGSKYIYSEWLLKETLAFLPENIRLPDDISPLVQKVYSAADDSKEYSDFRNDIESAKGRAEGFLLKKPKCRDIHGFFSRIVDTADENIAEASVRDGISSVEVILMQRYPDGAIYFTDGTKLSPEISENECERIAEQKLRLPSYFCHKYNTEKTINEIENKCKPYVSELQKKPLLKGKLFLFLDENKKTKLNGYRLEYSFEKGLICKKESDKNE
ncbi:MAG: CRISPR-associated helicase Cas3' [Ruminococcus sp.]|nr:CRISPR-associated helicase Cas3' [Ruminococcus sp.]